MSLTLELLELLTFIWLALGLDSKVDYWLVCGLL